MGEAPKLTPFIPYPDEILPPVRGAPTPRTANGHLIVNGQRLVPIKPKVRNVRIAAASRGTKGTRPNWIGIFEEVASDVGAQAWSRQAFWEDGFWNKSPDAYFHRKTKLPVSLEGAPFDAVMAMSMRLQARLINAPYVDDFSVKIPPGFVELLSRGEEPARNLIQFLDQMRVMERVAPGVTRNWWAPSPDRMPGVGELYAYSEMLTARRISVRSLALAILDAHIINQSQNFRLWEMMKIGDRLIAVQDRSKQSRILAAHEDWMVDYQIAAGIPGNVGLPKTLRFGWQVPSNMAQPGLVLTEISDGGQLIYVNRLGKRIVEGLTMGFHPKVANWGWGVSIPVDASNAAYLLPFLNDPPDRCPWEWYEAWGDGSYNRSGKHRSMPSSVTWG